MRRFRVRLGVIAAVGLAVRLTYIFAERAGTHLDAAAGVVGGDAFFYQKGAWLLPHHGFISPQSFLIEHRLVQSAEHPPLYLLWLAIPAFMHIVSPVADMVWSAVLGTGTVVLVGLLGREIVNARVGLVAAALAALYPNVWSLDGFLMSETMALFTATLAAWLAYRYWRSPTPRRLAALSVGCALATLSRAELVLLFPLVVLPLIVITRSRIRTAPWRLVAIAAIAGVLPIAPWVIFNMVRFEKPVYLSTGFGVTLASANCDATYYGPSTGYWNMQCAQRIRDRFSPELDQSEQDIVFRDKAMTYIGNHQSRLPYVVLARWGRVSGTWNPWQQVAFEQYPENREKWLAVSALMWWCVLVPLTIAGAFVLRARRTPLFPLVAIPVTVLVAVTLTFATNRYRAPMETMMCVLPAVALVALYDALRARRAADDVDLTELEMSDTDVHAPA